MGIFTGLWRSRDKPLQKSTEKNDDAVAMIMALDRAIRCGCVSEESVYDSREMLIL